MERLNLDSRSLAPNMAYSDQPYTTWSRMSRRSSQSRTPDQSQIQNSKQQLPSTEKSTDKHLHPQYQQQNQGSKSSSLPNLMRKSLMKRSLETGAHCVKVYDLQNSLRSSQFNNVRSIDANNFSLMKLFIKQKSLSKEQMSLSSSGTEPSAEGGSSSDWPMNSQSDMDGSSSPVNSVDKSHNKKTGMSLHINDFISSETETTEEGAGNNNFENTNYVHSLDNMSSFEDSLKDPLPCSKPPMTSPIREEPEGMDISFDLKGENKALLDQSEKETISNLDPVLRLKDSKTDQNVASMKVLSKEINNKNIQGKNKINTKFSEENKSGAITNNKEITKDSINGPQRRRQDSGNVSSGYISNRGSTDKIKKSSDSEKLSNNLHKPKPKPRYIKQMSDQCLQTSNLNVSAPINATDLLEKKEVYVYYPNYALPDLGFLKDKKYNVDARIFLVPQHYMIPTQNAKRLREKRSRRPFSCGDLEKLRQQGFKHIKDWDSLNFLLPKELKEMLMDESECMETTKPSFCLSPRTSTTNTRPVSCDFGQTNNFKSSASSLNSTQPSSGYRGSSTMLNDSSDSEQRTRTSEREVSANY